MRFALFLLISCLGFDFGALARAATFRSEYELLRQLPAGALSSLVAGGEPDAQGLVGLQKMKGAWYESGMQRGGCWYLIGAVVAGDESRAETAWKSIETTFAHQLDDGGVSLEPQSVPRSQTVFR